MSPGVHGHDFSCIAPLGKWPNIHCRFGIREVRPGEKTSRLVSIVDLYNSNILVVNRDLLASYGQGVVYGVGATTG
jgi:hypothetical protein